MLQTETFEAQYRLKANFVFAAAMLIFFIRFIGNGLLSQIGPVPFLFPQTEWVYVWFAKAGIGQFLTSHSAAGAMFDVSLFFVPVIFFATYNRWFAVLYLVLCTMYFLTFNLLTGHHYHGLVGLLVILIPFCSKSEARFNNLWQLARYYLLYIFVSAACWKLVRGSAFYPEQMANILKPQQLNLLAQHPGSLRAQIASYFIAHTAASHAVLLVNVVVQLLFAAGFITKKFDRYLFALTFIFVIGNYLVMGIFSAELLVLALTLLNWQQVERLTVKYLGKNSSQAAGPVAAA